MPKRANSKLNLTLDRRSGLTGALLEKAMSDRARQRRERRERILSGELVPRSFDREKRARLYEKKSREAYLMENQAIEFELERLSCLLLEAVELRALLRAAPPTTNRLALAKQGAAELNPRLIASRIAGLCRMSRFPLPNWAAFGLDSDEVAAFEATL